MRGINVRSVRETVKVRPSPPGRGGVRLGARLSSSIVASAAWLCLLRSLWCNAKNHHARAPAHDARTRARARRERCLRFRCLFLCLYVAAASHLAPCSAAALPDPAPLDPALIFPSATPAQPGSATIPAFPEQSDAASGTSSTCPLATSPSLLPAVTSSCDGGGGALTTRLRCCPTLAAWLFAAYAPAALALRPAKSAAAAAVDMPVPPDDSETCAGAADRALRSEGAAMPRPPGANGTCDVAFCYCGVRLTCGPAPAEGGEWTPADAAARRLEKDCAQPGVPGCSKCLRALTTIKAGSGGAAAPAAKKKKQQGGRTGERDCQLMGIMWLLQRNATRYGAAGTATAVIQALMAADEASAAGVAAAVYGPAACSLPVDDMPLPAEYARFSEAGSPPAVSHLYVLLLVVFGVVAYSL